MSKFEQRPNTGILFKNDKDGVEARPDYRGEANIGGAALEISAWIKQGKNGKFLSLSFKGNEQQARTPGGGFDDSDNDPF